MNYVMSDIHGNIKAFHSVLNQIDLQSTDSLYILGDVIDRRKYGISILQEIMEMPNAYMLLGNHEYMMMRALGFPYDGEGDILGERASDLRKQWYMNGGRVTHEAWKQTAESDRQKIAGYLKDLPLSYEIQVGDRLFKLIHGAPEDLYDFIEAPEDYSRTFYSVWDRESVFLLADLEVVTSVFGHTPTIYFQDADPLEIFHYKAIIGIDCGAGFTGRGKYSGLHGRLACLRLEDMKEFYS